MCVEELVAPGNGYIDFTSGSSPPYNYLVSVTYGCNVGFRLVNGDRVRTCVGSVTGPGEWSGTAPTCEGILITPYVAKNLPTSCKIMEGYWFFCI